MIGDDPTALTAVGSALGLCCDQDGATAYIERALALDPNNAWAWTRYGLIAVYHNDGQRANARFERALTLSPLDPFAFPLRIGLASAAAITGDFCKAVQIVREVLNRNPRGDLGLPAPCRMVGPGRRSGDRAAGGPISAGPSAECVAFELYKRYVPSNQVPLYLDRMLEGLRLAGFPRSSEHRSEGSPFAVRLHCNIEVG